MRDESTRRCVLAASGGDGVLGAGSRGSGGRSPPGGRGAQPGSIAGSRAADRRADVNATSDDGSTPLLWAAHWNDVAVAESLIRAGADANVANDSA